MFNQGDFKFARGNLKAQEVRKEQKRYGEASYVIILIPHFLAGV